MTNASYKNNVIMGIQLLNGNIDHVADKKDYAYYLQHFQYWRYMMYVLLRTKKMDMLKVLYATYQ